MSLEEIVAVEMPDGREGGMTREQATSSGLYVVTSMTIIYDEDKRNTLLTQRAPGTLFGGEVDVGVHETLQDGETPEDAVANAFAGEVPGLFGLHLALARRVIWREITAFGNYNLTPVFDGKPFYFKDGDFRRRVHVFETTIPDIRRPHRENQEVSEVLWVPTDRVLSMAKSGGDKKFRKLPVDIFTTYVTKYGYPNQLLTVSAPLGHYGN